MNEIITHIVDIALPILLTYVVWLLKEERSDRKANTEGMKEILGYMIDRWYDEFTLQGYVTTDQRNTFERVYKAYAANKGNGARATKWHEIEKMHIDDTKSGVSPYLKFYLECSKFVNKNKDDRGDTT
jgi:hypothetical protein